MRITFEIRFDYKNGRDIWSLEYLPTGKVWIRDGIAAKNVLKTLAEHYIEFILN